MRYSTVSLMAAACAALALAVAPGAAMARSNVQKVCVNHMHDGYGEHKIKATAVQIAVDDWRDAVTAHDGASFAHLPKSAKIDCQKIHKNGVNVSLCHVNHRPCKNVPVDLPSSVVPSPGPIITN